MSLRVPVFSIPSNSGGPLSGLNLSSPAIRGLRETRSKTKNRDSTRLAFRGANLEIQSYRGREFLLSGPAERSEERRVGERVYEKVVRVHLSRDYTSVGRWP